MNKLFIILVLFGCSGVIHSMQSSGGIRTSINDQIPDSPNNSTDEEEDRLKGLATAKTREDSMAIIMKALTMPGEEWVEETSNTELHRKQSLEKAKKIFNNRFRQNLACSPGVVKSTDRTLFNNFLQGVSFYTDANGKPGPYGQFFSIWFNRNECDIETGNMGVVGMHYQRMPSEVVVFSRFKQLAFRIPYPFAKHIFKVRGGVAIPGCSGNADIEFMSVPTIKSCSNISDDVLLERLSGKKFVGYTRNDEIKISLKNQSIVTPFLYTVVEFNKEGYMSICYPAINKIIIPDGTYAVKGSVIVVGGRNIGFVKNNGDAISLANPYSGGLYKLSDSFSPATSTSKSTSTKPSTKKSVNSRNTNRTTIQRKPTSKKIKSNKI